MRNRGHCRYEHNRNAQAGVAAVEFGLVAILFFAVLLAIVEFGRFMYVWNTVQEVTRHAAREAAVSRMDSASIAKVKRLALFGGTSLPAAAEISGSNIRIDYLTASGGVPDPLPATAEANISACLNGAAGCIALVSASITDASYVPMMGLFSFLSIPIPPSTVTTPAESLGYAPS